MYRIIELMERLPKYQYNEQNSSHLVEYDGYTLEYSLGFCSVGSYRGELAMVDEDEYLQLLERLTSYTADEGCIVLRKWFRKIEIAAEKRRKLLTLTKRRKTN